MESFLSNVYEYASSPQKLRYVSSSWNEAILTEEQLIMDSLHKKYPGISCLYDIMILIAHNDDIDTLKSILISYRGYLPINWNRYSYHVKSLEMLRLLLPYLTEDTKDLVERRIYIRTHNDISKLELKKYLYAILLEKRYDILTDSRYAAQDWIPYVSSIKDIIPREARQWLIDQKILRSNILIPFHERIYKDNLDTYTSTHIYTIVQVIDRFMVLLKEYPTDKNMIHTILGFSLIGGYIEILDCYLTKANYIPSLALTNHSYSIDTGIFLVRNGFAHTTDFLSDLPMNILTKILATLIAKDNLSLYKYVLTKNWDNISPMRDKVNDYISTLSMNREIYIL